MIWPNPIAPANAGLRSAMAEFHRWAKEKNLRIIRSVTYGLVMGGIISILPLPFNLLLILVLCAFFGGTLMCSPTRFNWIERSFEAGLVTTVVVTAILLPVKHLDRSVGPMHYESMPLGQLTQALAHDWGVFISPSYHPASEPVISFSTSEAMSRRQILQKLAQATGGELHIGYCGTGATFLFGAHPSFTRLTIPQPQHPANGSQPFRSKTNLTSETVAATAAPPPSQLKSRRETAFLSYLETVPTNGMKRVFYHSITNLPVAIQENLNGLGVADKGQPFFSGCFVGNPRHGFILAAQTGWAWHVALEKGGFVTSYFIIKYVLTPSGEVMSETKSEQSF